MHMRLAVALLSAALLVACSAASPSSSPEPAVSRPTPPPTVIPAVQPTDAPPSTNLEEATGEAGPAAPTTVPTSAPAADPASLRFRLEPVADQFARPTHVTAAGDGSGRLFVVEQEGRIWIVRAGARLPEPFLDIVPLVGSRSNEQGLLSIAFHPRFAENDRLFVNYTDRNGDTVVARYSIEADNPDRVDHDSAALLLTIEQPAPNHNGGLLKFGPDGYLYIGMGDGGAAGDPWGNGQNLESLLGKLLRIDVDGSEPYAVPPDNPFVGQAGARPEIWAWGLRNPWRFSFDRRTGDLFIADVGQNAYEEVHFQPAGSPGGQNYGWNIMEGADCFRAQNCEQENLEQPVAVYAHASREGGCSITGGYVYRGATIPALAGVYLYTDYCTGFLWALRPVDNQWQSAVVGQIEINASSFGEDEAGELYLTDRDGGGLYRLVVE